MKAMAAEKHVSVKLSQLSFCKKGWEKNVEDEKLAKKIARRVIEIFGVDRCMFATNFPVDRFFGVEMDVLYKSFDDWTNDFSHSDRQALFGGNAKRVYRLE